MNKQLLSILVCPIAKCPLEYDEAAQELISRAMRLAYPIHAGVPILLEAEARLIKNKDH